MKRRQCPVCGSDIAFSLITPRRDFYLNENDFIEEDTNNLFSEYGGEVRPFFEFYCSNDREHELNNSKSQIEWEEEIQEHFKLIKGKIT